MVHSMEIESKEEAARLRAAAAVFNKQGATSFRYVIRGTAAPNLLDVYCVAAQDWVAPVPRPRKVKDAAPKARKK
jgi:hypothetical protein